MDTTEEKKVGIPESITINGVTYLVKDTPELQQFIQEVAKVEKSKLYTQFENLKAQIANLNKVKVVGEGGSNFNVDELVEKLKGTFITKEDLKDTLAGTVKEVVQPVLAATEQNRQDELAAYRNKLIQENIATCIPELVTGNTKEELDASLQRSIELRTKYPSPSTANLRPDAKVHDPLVAKQQEELEAARRYTPTPAGGEQMPPAAPRRQSPDASNGTGSNVKQMSEKEFAQNREQLEAQLRAMYGN